MIDIVPPIGAMVENGQTGIRGDALRKAVENMEPYYLKEFTSIKRIRANTHSSRSEYGRSEDVQLVMKDGKEVDVIRKEEEENLSPSFNTKGNENKKQN